MKHLVENWHHQFDESILQIEIGDVNNNGIKEIIVASKSGRLLILSMTGKVLVDKKLTENSSIWKVEVRDIDNDANNELILGGLDGIYKKTDLDTRKYLTSIIDQIQDGKDLKSSLEQTFKEIEIGAGANAFLFNSQMCNIITNHKSNFNGRHHTLFINRNNDEIIVSTTPLIKNAKEIPNYSLIQINLANLHTTFTKLSF